jgi:hypothetical protein
MWMSDAEVVQSFLTARNKKEQIKILAELNACSTQKIIQILDDSSRVSYEMLDTALGRNKSKEYQELTKEKQMDLLKDEVHRAYRLCTELEEENRSLKNEIILILNEILQRLCTSESR